MSAQAKGKAKAVANAKANVKTPCMVAAPALGQAAIGINAKYSVALQTATTTMMEHHVFASMGKDKPQQLCQTDLSLLSLSS